MEPERDMEIQVADETIVRSFAAEMVAGDGRTVDVRIVPYGETITHNDGLGGVPRGTPYQEEWLPGVFANQERAANRVLANFEHEPGLRGVVGHGLSLHEGRDGFYGSFKLHEGPDGDKALMLVREGVLGGVSLEARPQKSVRTVAGVVQRVKAHLRAIALCRDPAYKSAVVLALRTPAIIDETLMPIDMAPELVQRLRGQGIALPDRYKEHPAKDTPPDGGTSEDGTLLDTSTQSSEGTQHDGNNPD